MLKTELSYRTFDELLDAVKLEMPLQNIEGFIEPIPLIKVARRINKELLAEVDNVQETVLTFNGGKAKLPDGFRVMNFAMLCFNGSRTTVHYKPTTEEVVTEGCYPTDKPYTRYDDCGNGVQVIQHFSTHTVTWNKQAPIHFTDSSNLRNDCPNRRCRSANTAYIKDGYVWLNVEAGSLYINYVADLEDREGNLLVLDHELVNEYYESELKAKILKMMAPQGEDVQGLYQLNEIDRRNAHIKAESWSRTPDFYQLVSFQRNYRNAIYKRFYNSFL